MIYDQGKEIYRHAQITENGSAYTAKEAIDFGQQLGQISCFTPVRSPQSSGWLKHLLKPLSGTIFIHDRPDTNTVKAQLNG